MLTLTNTYPSEARFAVCDMILSVLLAVSPLSLLSSSRSSSVSLASEHLAASLNDLSILWAYVVYKINDLFVSTLFIELLWIEALPFQRGL
jgi:hypothetical protein